MDKNKQGNKKRDFMYKGVAFGLVLTMIMSPAAGASKTPSPISPSSSSSKTTSSSGDKSSGTQKSTTSTSKSSTQKSTSSSSKSSAASSSKKASTSSTKKSLITKDAEALVKYINEEREKVGADPLELDETLQKAAKIRAEEAAVKFSHTRPDGSTYSTVFAEVGQTEKYYSAENLSAGRSEAEKVCEGWMASAGHKKNMLNPVYSRAGIYHVTSTDTKYADYWVIVLQG